MRAASKCFYKARKSRLKGRQASDSPAALGTPCITNICKTQASDKKRAIDTNIAI